MTAKPSGTDQGNAWLANFEPSERDTAALLLDSLQVAGAAHMRASLLALLERALTLGHVESPAVMIPVRSIEDLPPTDGGGRHTAFETYNPGVPMPTLSGSESFIGNLLRDLVSERGKRSSPPIWLPPTTTLEEMREHRVRSIVLVTDYSGTGTQVERFASTFARNRTIRSWRSGKLLQVHAAAYAVSAAAKTALAGSRSLDRTHIHLIAPSFATANWSSKERSEVERLCVAHAFRRGYALGYKSGRGLFVTDVSVPNNIPAVLWQDAEGWRPFFIGRKVYPGFADELSGYFPRRDLRAVASSNGQSRLARRLLRESAVTASGEILASLVLVEAGASGSAEIAAQMDVTIQRASEVLALCRLLDFLDGDCRLTDRGLRELRFAKRARRTVTEVLGRGVGSYYPQQLR